MSHQWLLEVEIKYDSSTTNGMPDNTTYELLDEIEDKLMFQFEGDYGFLNIGRETGNSVRIIYIACKDFRKAAKAIGLVAQHFASRITINYDIYKDKYWRTLNRYNSF